MKKLIILLCILLPIFGFSQNAYDRQLQSEVAYTNWKQEYPGGNGLPSFYWMITRSHNSDGMGRYFYKIYFFSNSRYSNGAQAGTYIVGIMIYVNGYVFQPEVGKRWIMFKETYQPSGFSFWASPNSTVAITWDNISIN